MNTYSTKLFLLVAGELLEYPLTKAGASEAIEEGRRLRLALTSAGTRQFGINVVTPPSSDYPRGETIYNFTQTVKARPTATPAT